MDINIMTLFATVAGFAAGAVAVTQALKAWLQELIGKDLKSWVKWVLSFITAIGLSMAGWGLKIGCFAGMQWYIALCTGVFTALASEGLYDSVLVQWIIDLIGNSRKSSKVNLDTAAVGLKDLGSNNTDKPTFEDVFRKMLYSNKINPNSLKTLMRKYDVIPYLKPKYAKITGDGTTLESDIRYWRIYMRCLDNVANVEEIKTICDDTSSIDRYVPVRINTMEDWINLETCLEKIAWGDISPTTPDSGEVNK